MDIKNNYLNLLKLYCMLILSLLHLLANGQPLSETKLDQDEFPFVPALVLKSDSSYETTLTYRQTALEQSGNNQDLLLHEPLKITFKINKVSMIKGANNDYPIVVTLGLKSPGKDYQTLNIYSEGSECFVYCLEKGIYTLSYGNYGVKYQGGYNGEQLNIGKNIVLASNIYKANIQIICEEIPREDYIAPYPEIFSPEYGTDSNLIKPINNNYVATYDKTTSKGEGGILSVKYYDDFGREEETINGCFVNDFKDVVSYQEYDEWGRKSRRWSPTPISSKSKGAYVPLSKLPSFTNECAYSYPVYEESLEGKVIKLFEDGYEWHVNDKCIKTDYFVNNENVDSLNCLNLSAFPNENKYNIKNTGNCMSGTLLITRMEDEDGRVSFLFKDIFGKTILQRQIEYVKNRKIFSDTYFIYGMIDNLLAVIPPTLSDNLSNGENLDENTIDDFAYCYIYDEYERNIAKKLPSCEWLFMYYDKADQMIFSQDGEQRKNNKAIFYTYDTFGRKCLVGECNANELQNVNKYTSCKYDGKENSFYGYQIDGLKIKDPLVISVNYFDKYDFLYDGWMSKQLDGSFSYENGYASLSPISQSYMTGSIRKILGTENQPGINTVMYYNEQGQIAQKKIFNYEYDNESVSYAYDYTDNPISIKRIYGTKDKSVEVYDYQYDELNRLIKSTLSINGGEKVTLNETEYDDLGRIRKITHANNAMLSTEYSYNNRSWLTSIKCNLFSETLHYNNADDSKLYSGMISAVEWNGYNQFSTNIYRFKYDQLGRLISAIYNNRKYYNSVYYEYDKMGNIISLTRSGERDNNRYGTIDILDYQYKGNQIIKISDKASGPYYKGAFHFVDGTDKDIEYFYNANGNMIQDLNKGITKIEYNVLNLPQLIKFKLEDAISGMEAEKTIEYNYDSDGGKRAVIYTDGANSTEDNTFSYSYTENRVFENGELKQILFDGGYVTIENATPQYHFYLKDHLGNNRIVANAKGQVEQTNTYYPFGALIKDGFSEDINSSQRYKYNGKELDRMYGLDWYDYGARMYDPSIIRWHTIDPLCEKYYSISPYAYCANNPINSLDMDGTSIYLLFYASGNAQAGQDGDEEFKAAAYTRKSDIEHSKYFNSSTDIVLTIPFNNISELRYLIEKILKITKNMVKLKR